MVKRFGIVGLIVLVMGLLIAPAAAAKKGGTDRPFKGRAAGEATFLVVDPLGCTDIPLAFGITTHTEAIGKASHMGKMRLISDHCPLVDGRIVGGAITMVAANGHELHGTYIGEATPVSPEFPLGDPVFVTVDVEFDGGTGRFSDATGWATLKAELVFEGFGDPAWPWKATWKGKLSY